MTCQLELPRAGARTVVLIGAILLGALCLAAGAERRDPRKVPPPQFPGAENHLRVPFLPPERDWERIDIYVPKGPPGARCPCILLYYGGGWGDKVPFGKEHIQALLDNGYAVAVPDYVLGAQNPVPIVVWDGAAAVRFLRAHAATYRIDPERIGAIGLSAGGWLAQYLGPSDDRTMIVVRLARGKAPFLVPMLEPHPRNGEFSCKLAAIVTDWGAQRLAEKAVLRASPGWLGPDDPPLFTVHNDPGGKWPPGPAAYRDAGAIAEIAFVDVTNTHCVVGVADKKDRPVMTKDKQGTGATLGRRTLQFLDEYVRNPRFGAAPEIIPHGGPIHEPTKVVLRSVHPTAAIHYTSDGTRPTAASPVYSGAISVGPSTTLKAIAVKPGLKPSPVATAVFRPCTLPPPVITTAQQAFTARVGEPFAATFEARSSAPVQWFIAGKVGTAVDRSTNPPKPITAFEIEAATGRLTGVPSAPGTCVFIVVASVQDGTETLVDARSVVVTVQP